MEMEPDQVARATLVLIHWVLVNLVTALEKSGSNLPTNSTMNFFKAAQEPMVITPHLQQAQDIGIFQTMYAFRNVVKRGI